MASIIRIVLILGLWAPPQPEGGGTAFEEVTLVGQAVSLAEVARGMGIQLEADPSSAQVVLMAADGRATPLLCNSASKALFTDARLRGRRARLVGRLHGKMPFVEVVAFQVEDESGLLATPEYYCDVCTISARYNQTCPCCQGPMELRLRPDHG